MLCTGFLPHTLCSLNWIELNRIQLNSGQFLFGHQNSSHNHNTLTVHAIYHSDRSQAPSTYMSLHPVLEEKRRIRQRSEKQQILSNQREFGYESHRTKRNAYLIYRTRRKLNTRRTNFHKNRTKRSARLCRIRKRKPGETNVKTFVRMIHRCKHQELGTGERKQHQRRRCNMGIRKPKYPTRSTNQIAERGRIGRCTQARITQQMKDIRAKPSGESFPYRASVMNIATENRLKRANSRSKWRHSQKKENVHIHVDPGARDSSRQDNVLSRAYKDTVVRAPDTIKAISWGLKPSGTQIKE
jgi:hypothetical protein